MASDNNIPIVPTGVSLPSAPTDLPSVFRWAGDIVIAAQRLYGTLAAVIRDGYQSGLFDSFPLTLTQNTFILDGHGTYVPGPLEIPAGIILEIGTGAVLEIG